MIILDVLQTTKGKNGMKRNLELPANLLFREGKFLFWYQPPWIFIITGTMSSATMLMILIKGLTAGPAVSL